MHRLVVVCVEVSIHAPRVGCDYLFILLIWFAYKVSIHAPRVGCDLQNRYIVEYYLKFQFTHPVWGAT